MRIGDTIYNLDGLPFRNLELAGRMRELLRREAGRRYEIEDYPEGGYVVRRALATLQGPRLHEAGDTPRSGNARRRYRPAVVRANLGMLPILLACLALLVVAGPLTLWAVVLLGLHPARLGPILGWIVDALRLGGGFGVLAIAALWSSEWLSARYTVSATGVEARRGIATRQAVGLRFQDIRSVTLRQSLGQRLLGIGTLEFTSAGTDGVPVQFYDIARPSRVKALIEALMAGEASDD